MFQKSRPSHYLSSVNWNVPTQYVIISYHTWLGAVLCRCRGLMYGLYLCIIHSVPLLILTPPHMYVRLNSRLGFVPSAFWDALLPPLRGPPVACWCVHGWGGGGPKIKNLWKLKISIELRVTWQTWHVSVSDVRVCPEERLSWRLEVSVSASYTHFSAFCFLVFLLVSMWLLLRVIMS